MPDIVAKNANPTPQLDSSMAAFGAAARANPTAPAPAKPQLAPRQPSPRPPQASSAADAIANSPVVQATRAILAPNEAESDQRIANDDAMIEQYTQMQHANWAAEQRQRLVTVNRAKIIKRVLPIVGLFALIAGKSDGMDGALAALGGGLAGLQSGMERQFQDAWRQYNAEAKKTEERAKDISAQLKEVMADREKTATQKMDDARAIAGSMKVAFSSLQAQNRAEFTQEQENARHLQTLQLEVQKFDWQRAQAARALGDANGAVSSPTDDEVQQAASAIFGDKLPTGGKLTAAQHWQAAQVAQAAKASMFGGKNDYAGALRDTVSHIDLHKIGTAPLSAGEIERKTGGAGGTGPNGAFTEEDRLALEAGATPGNLKTFEGGLDAAAIGFIANNRIEYQGNYGRGAKNATTPSRFTVEERATQILQSAGLSTGDLPALRARASSRVAAMKKVQETQSMLDSKIGALRPDIQKMLAAARDVGTGRLPPWNGISLATRRAAGDPKVAAYEQAVLDVQADYGPILSFSANSSGSTVFSLRTSIEALSKSLNYDQLTQSANQLLAAAENTNHGLQTNLNALSGGLTMMGLGRSNVSGSDIGDNAGNPVGPEEGALPPGVSVQQVP